MRKFSVLAAACCLFVSVCFASTQPVHPNPFRAHYDSLKTVAVSNPANIQIVHNGGSTIRNIVSFTINGVAVPLTGAATSVYYGAIQTGANTFKVTYSNMAATDCFNVLCALDASTTIYNTNYAGTNVAEFTITLPADRTFMYLQLLDNIGCQ